MRTFLGAPIRLGDQGLGNLYLTEKQGTSEFTAEDEDLLVLFTSQAALAIRNAPLYQGVADERNRTRDILDNTAAVIYVKDTEGRYVLTNRRYETLFHVDGEDIRGKTDYDVFPREQADAFWSNDREVLDTGSSMDVEGLAPHDDGLHIYISLKFPLFGPSGQAYAVCGISTDITDRKRAEEQAQAEQERLQALVEASPVGVVVVDAVSNELVLVNLEAQRLLGVPPNPGEALEAYGQEIAYLRSDGSPYLPEDRPLQRALSGGETTRAEEMRFRHPDGHSIPTLVSAVPVYGPDGRITGDIAVMQDITPLQEIEALRSEFLGMVSHELKTPLTVVKGSAAMALGTRRPLTTEETRELFEIIDEQSDRLRDLVDNILDMTRIEAGSLSVSAEPTDLRQVIREAQDAFVRNGGPQDVFVHVPEGVPMASADPRRVFQVINNLLGNAAKFSPATSPIQIDVEYDPVDITVHVRDMGRGISGDMAPHLFKKFVQIHDESSHKLAGSGLGLAICKGIVESHGERIWVESAGEGRGSTFSFTVLGRR